MDKLLIKSYMEQVTRYPLLSAEEEIELSRKIQKGDEEAKMKLVNSNLRLVVSIATKYASGQNSLMDLIQEGNLGLITAAGKFNHSFNTRFGTYAHSWITQSILRYIHGHIPTISIPFRKEEKLRNVKKSEVVLKQKLGRNPTLKELAVYLDISEESVKEILLLDYSYSSLNAEIKGTEGLTEVNVTVGRLEEAVTLGVSTYDMSKLSACTDESYVVLKINQTNNDVDSVEYHMECGK